MEGFHNIVFALPALPNEMARPVRDINEGEHAAVGIQKKSVFLVDYKPLWGCSSLCGRRSEMKGAYVMVPGFIEVPIWMLTKEKKIEGIDDMSGLKVTAHFFGVYDGHGGTQVVNYCHNRIHLALTEELKKIEAVERENVDFAWEKEWEKAFINCFQKVDEECKLITPDTSGSTALVAVVTSSHIIVANCGHSRAVLSRNKQAIPLSFDHRPEREQEYARIAVEQGGEFVLNLLAMSRSIGDGYLKPLMISLPEVTILPRAKDDDCLILASNGLWDVATNKEVSDLARKKIMVWHKKKGTLASSEYVESDHDRAAQSAAKSLLKLALHKGSEDNITVMVIDLKSKWKFKSNP